MGQMATAGRAGLPFRRRRRASDGCVHQFRGQVRLRARGHLLHVHGRGRLLRGRARAHGLLHRAHDHLLRYQFHHHGHDIQRRYHQFLNPSKIFSLKLSNHLEMPIVSLLPSFLIDCSASRDHVLHHVVLPVHVSVHVPVHEDLETPPLPVHPGQVAHRDLYSLKLSYLFNRIPIWMCRRWLYQVSCYSPSAAHCSRPLKGQVLQRVSYLCMVSCFITSFSLL